ncbi:MAG: magnesium transporter CorA family protein [Clostridiales bacterium]|nr:magnesium transporter CorA family protein [Clostridiales bacterium]
MIEIFKTNSENKLEVITEESYMANDFDPKHCWINLVNPSDKEVALISKMSGVDDDAIKAALDDEERSRIELEDNYALVLVDIPVIEEEDDYYSYFTIPLGTIVKDDLFITICLKDTAVIRDFVRNRIKGFSTSMKSRFMFQILGNTAAKFLAYLKQIDKASQRIQIELRKSTKNKEIIQMLDLQNSLVYFSTSLTGNDTVISKIMNAKGQLGKFLRIYEEDMDILEDVSIENKQAIEMCSIYRSILATTTEGYASVISNDANSVMKLLTSITLVISIPTLIASIWGMNTWVPGQSSWIGFTVLAVVSVVVTALSVWILKKKKLL